MEAATSGDESPEHNLSVNDNIEASLAYTDGRLCLFVV